ncbi:MAG: hypothetical protein ACTSUB_00440 [Candidatus Thorarchaeota archaeon]
MKTDLSTIYPIVWIEKSKIVMDFLYDRLMKKPAELIMVSDFGSGENEEIPLFFSNFFHDILEDYCVMTGKEKVNYKITPQPAIYCLDINEMKLLSLLDKMEQENAIESVRVVSSKLETMDTEAHFPDYQQETIANRSIEMNWLDSYITENNRVPECFDIGVLNNDIIGYLSEYYTQYSDLEKCLSTIRKTMKQGGLLIVTAPRSLYQVDNIGVLEEAGFTFIEGVDIDLKSGEVQVLNEDIDQTKLGLLYHYAFLVFSAS